MDKLYKKHDKIMLKDTGEVLTVLEDLSTHMEPGIIVQEKIGCMLLHCEVRAAGRTRQRLEAGIGITEPEPPPPLPPDRLNFEKIEATKPT